MSDRYIFLDFDNTLVDHVQLKALLAQEIGATLAPKYGGDVDKWTNSAAAMIAALEEDYRIRFQGNPLAGYCDWLENRHTKAVELLFGGIGVPIPADSATLAKETQFNALASCDASLPGAYAALNTLFEEDVRVQMASANESDYLLAALIGAGIESFTESKFGPDLVDCAKEGPEFYTRIFEASSISPADTLVIDDQPEALAWAQEAGARVIQARLAPNNPFGEAAGVVAVLTDLTQLPGLVRQFLG